MISLGEHHVAVRGSEVQHICYNDMFRTQPGQQESELSSLSTNSNSRCTGKFSQPSLSILVHRLRLCTLGAYITRLCLERLARIAAAPCVQRFLEYAVFPAKEV